MSDTKTSFPNTPSGDANPAVTRALNVPFLVVSIVALGIVSAVLYQVRQWQVRRTAVALLQRADQLESNSEWFSAAEHIQRYVQLFPRADQERVRLAQVYEKGVKTPSQRDRAINLHYRAVGISSADQQLVLRRRLARLLLENQRFAEARAEAEKLLATLPFDSEGKEIRAKALWSLWENGALVREGLNRRPATIGEAGTNPVIIALEDAFEASPDNIALAVALANAYRDRELKAFDRANRALAANESANELSESERADLAVACLDKLVSQRPKNARAYLARSAYRMKWGIADAVADMEEALRLAPEDVTVLLVAADVARREGQRLQKADVTSKEGTVHLERARDFYRKCLAIEPTQALARLALGDTLLLLHQPAEAIEIWRAGLEEAKRDPLAIDYQLRLVNAWLGEDNLGEAQRSLEAIKKAIGDLPHNTPREAIRTLELEQDLRWGMLHLKRGQPKLAISFLKNVIIRQEQLGGKSDQSVRALLMLGAAYAELEDWVASGETYDRATIQEPSLVQAYLAASASWLMANEMDNALERAEQAVRLEPTSRSWFTLAKSLYQQQMLLSPAERVWSRLDQALATAQQRADDATLAEPWRVDLLMADCLLGREDDSLSAIQRTQDAMELLQRSESKYPTDLGFWAALPLAYQKMGAAAEADRCCDQLAQLPGGAQHAGLLQARLLLLRGQHQAAEKALLRITQGPDAVDADVAQRELIGIKLAQQDYSGGRALLEATLKQTPTDLNVLRRLADLDLESRKFEDVQRWEAAMLKCGPAGEAIALYFKIRRSLLVAKSAKDPILLAAIEDHADLMRLRPSWAEAVALGGLIEESQGNDEQAILAYQRAISLGEQRISIYERLIGLLERANRSSEAESYLTRLRSDVSVSHELTVYESTLELRRNQLDEAIEVAKKGVRTRPQDAKAHIWLGRMLLGKKLDKEAERCFQEAVKLKPEEFLPWKALFDFYLQTGDRAQATKILAMIPTKVRLKPADLSFVLAQCYEMLDKREQAAVEYAKALAANPKSTDILLRSANFYREVAPEKSLDYAQRAYELDPSSVPVRRMLAAVLSDRGRDSDWETIERLLSNSDTHLASEDNRYRAILLMRRGGMKNLTAALHILEELAARPDSRKDNDHLLLAQLYERQARLADSPATAQTLVEKAYEQLSSLANRTSQPAHLVALVEFAQRHKLAQSAEQGLAKISALVNDSTSSALLADYVRLNLAQGNVSEAERGLTSLEKAEPNALICVAFHAAILEKRNQSDEIERLVESAAERLVLVATRPEDKANLYFGLGELYLSLKMLGPAEKWYREMVKLNPKRFDRLVLVLTEQGRARDALQICRSHSDAKDLVPGALAAASVLASGKASRTEATEGETLLAAAYQQQPESLPLLSATATLRVIQGQSDEAVKMFEQMVKINGRDPLALNNLATLLAEQEGQRDQALRLIDQALLIAGREASLLDTKGTILWLKGDIEAAVANLEAATREPDADPRFRFHLALAYRDSNRTRDAKSELQRAISRDLDKQVLTSNEKKLLAELRTQLSL